MGDMANSYSAFFYGTLMHPSILRRVIGHDGADLKIAPALILEHTRHHVKSADYPGVIPYESSVELLGRELSPEERTVRGTLVTGLNDSDVALLDIFEGDEYTREVIPVHPLTAFTALAENDAPNASIVPSTPPPVPPLTSLAPPLLAHTYIWAKPSTHLLPEIWDYEHFVRENAWKWVGSAAADNKDYAEVDKRREMGGVIVRAEIVDAVEA